MLKNFNKTLFILYFLSALNPLFSMDLTKEEKDFLTLHPNINVHMEKNYPPFSYTENNKIVGFSVDYANLIAKKLGVTFTYSNNQSWNTAIKKLENKEIDIIAQMMNTKKRKEYSIFTDNYMSYYQSIIVKNENSNFNSMEKLKGKTIGIVEGYATINPIKKFYPSIKIKTYKNTKDIIHAVILNEVDASISTHQVVLQYLISNFINDVISIPIINNSNIPQINEAFGIRKDYKLLHSSIQKTIKELDLEKKRLQIKWFGSTEINKQTNNEIDFLSIDELNYLKNTNSITMCIDPNWMPFEAFDEKGNYYGMSSDYYSLLGDMLNINFKTIKTNSWTQSLKKVKKRECDILSLAMQTPERKKYLNFTSSFIQAPLVLATKIHFPFINDLKELSNFTIGIPKDYAYGSIIEKSYPNVNIKYVDNIDEGFKNVNKGKLDAYIDTLTSVGYKIQNEYLGEIKIAGKLKETLQLKTAVRNDNLILLNILEKALKQIPKEGHLKISQKWMLIKYENKVDNTLAWKIGFVSVFSILFISYWNRKIRIANKLLKEAHEEIKKNNKELITLATTDNLTKLNNRNKLDEIITNEIKRFNRYEKSFAFCILDIDHFKVINDTYGHQVGDLTLKALASTLKQHIRKTDFVGRWGGEEFVIICPETTKDGMWKLIENLRIKIEKQKFKNIEKVTASFGITIVKKNDNYNTIITRADKALYEAKNAGRNKSVIII